MAFGILSITFIGLAQSSDVVNLAVSMDLPSDATSDQVNASKAELLNIFNAASVHKLDWTIFVTREAADKAGNSLATFFTGMGGISGEIELGITGDANEMLSSKSYSEQKAMLEETKTFTEDCKICGVNEVKISGFMPESFDQNEDTYKVIDDLGIEYNAGFQAGIISLPGHEADVWPYKIENHKFYAVPISTYMLSGELVPLDDSYAKDNGISSSQWKDMLIGKLDEISGKDEPMVISLSTSISGSGEYLDALEEFMAYASSAGAQFVLTRDLVEMSKTGIHASPEGSTESIAQDEGNETTVSESDCPACDSEMLPYSNETASNDTVFL